MVCHLLSWKNYLVERNRRAVKLKIKCEVCEFHFKEGEGLKNNEREWDKFLDKLKNLLPV